MPLLATTPVPDMTVPYARRWWALLVLCLSLLITVMANTSLIVAAPDLTADLGLSSSDLQWVVDGYTVPYAALMLVLGSIGDKYSRRGALVLGLLLFAGGSVVGSMVDETAMLIAARAIMGIGAAVVMPATLSLLVATFPRSERGKAVTAWAATSGVAVAVGPLVAGWLLEDHDWGSTFLINVPIAALAVVGALVLVPPSKAEDMGRIDYVGGLLSILTLGSLIYGAIEGPHSGSRGSDGRGRCRPGRVRGLGAAPSAPNAERAQIRAAAVHWFDARSAGLLLRTVRGALLCDTISAIRPRLRRPGYGHTVAAFGGSGIPRVRDHRNIHP